MLEPKLPWTRSCSGARTPRRRSSGSRSPSMYAAWSRTISVSRRRNTDISLLFDLGASREPTDIACNKDQMLAEAAWAEHVRKTARQISGSRQAYTILQERRAATVVDHV